MLKIPRLRYQCVVCQPTFFCHYRVVVGNKKVPAVGTAGTLGYEWLVVFIRLLRILLRAVRF